MNRRRGNVRGWLAVVAIAAAIAGAACAAKAYVPTQQNVRETDKPRRDFSNVTPAALNQHRAAIDAFNQGDYPNAARHWREALNTGARDAGFLYEVHYNLGVTFQKMEKHILAEQNFRRAVALDENNARGYVGLGSALGLQGRQDEAFAQFRKALDLAPNMPEAYAGMAAMAVASGRFEDAVDALRVAHAGSAAVDPDGKALTEADVALAAQRVRDGRLDEAQMLYARAAARSPKDPRPLFGQGYVMLRLGYPGRARGSYESAHAIAGTSAPQPNDVMPSRRGKPDATEALRAESMARLFRERGDFERAARQYRLLLELDPYRNDIWLEFAELAGDEMKDRESAADCVHALWVLGWPSAPADELALAIGADAPALPSSSDWTSVATLAGGAVMLDGSQLSGTGDTFKAGQRVYRLLTIAGGAGRHRIESRLYSPSGELARNDEFEMDFVREKTNFIDFDTLTHPGTWKQEWTVDGKLAGSLTFLLQNP